MEVRYCDICKQILKGEIYFVAYQKYHLKPKNEKKKYEQMSMEEFQRKIKDSYSNMQKVEYREICQECFKIVEKLFTVRVRKLNKIRKELDKLEKKMNEEG